MPRRLAQLHKSARSAVSVATGRMERPYDNLGNQQSASKGVNGPDVKTALQLVKRKKDKGPTMVGRGGGEAAQGTSRHPAQPWPEPYPRPRSPADRLPAGPVPSLQGSA